MSRIRIISALSALPFVVALARVPSPLPTAADYSFTKPNEDFIQGELRTLDSTNRIDLILRGEDIQFLLEGEAERNAVWPVVSSAFAFSPALSGRTFIRGGAGNNVLARNPVIVSHVGSTSGDVSLPFTQTDGFMTPAARNTAPGLIANAMAVAYSNDVGGRVSFTRSLSSAGIDEAYRCVCAPRSFYEPFIGASCNYRSIQTKEESEWRWHYDTDTFPGTLTATTNTVTTLGGDPAWLHNTILQLISITVTRHRDRKWDCVTDDGGYCTNAVLVGEGDWHTYEITERKTTPIESAKLFVGSGRAYTGGRVTGAETSVSCYFLHWIYNWGAGGESEEIARTFNVAGNFKGVEEVVSNGETNVYLSVVDPAGGTMMSAGRRNAGVSGLSVDLLLEQCETPDEPAKPLGEKTGTGEYYTTTTKRIEGTQVVYVYTFSMFFYMTPKSTHPDLLNSNEGE